MASLQHGIPTTTEIRAIISRYQRSRADADALARQLTTGGPDIDLLDLLADPFESVDDVHDRLTRLERYFREHNDRRSVFLTVYARMTAAVRAGIQSGVFSDPDWTRKYLITFAEHYRRALLAFEQRDFDAVPPPWRIGFATSLRGDALVAQDALLGINAHINYDLTYTLQEVTIDPDRDAKRRDHNTINDILKRLIDVAQKVLSTVYSAVTVSEIDKLLGQFDEQLAFLGLQQSRQFAWRNAVLLTDLSWPLITRYVDWRVRTVSTGAAQLILSPQLNPETRLLFEDAEAAGDTVATFNGEFEKQLPATLFDP